MSLFHSASQSIWHVGISHEGHEMNEIQTIWDDTRCIRSRISRRNFYEKSYGILSYWDKKIFKNIINKYKFNKKFSFMNKPIFNHDLLKKLNKNCIL